VIALARKTLIYEWRRFMPVAFAIGFACLLQLLQASLVLGIFRSASVQVSGSSAQLWVGYPGTATVNLGRPIPEGVEALLRMDPAVVRVEPFQWRDGNWRGANGNVSVSISGINPEPDGLLYAHVLTPGVRTRLREPDSVIVDRADLAKLGVIVGDSASVNGHRVRVVAESRGLRSLSGINIVASLETTRRLDAEDADASRPTYLVAQLHEPRDADMVAARLCCKTAFGPYQVWTAADFARRSELYWMLDTGAGAGVLFLAVIVLAAGAAISSQALMGAVAGSVREYAMLNALGVGLGSLRWVVLEQALWVGAAGLTGAMILGALLLLIAQSQDVPVVFNPSVTLACILVALGVTGVSGLAAVRSLRHAEPAILLR
jgi:putative ABC transport system permease protein